MFKTDSKGTWNFITGSFYQGRFVPMGNSKSLEYAKETAKGRVDIICELRILTKEEMENENN